MKTYEVLLPKVKNCIDIVSGYFPTSCMLRVNNEVYAMFQSCYDRTFGGSKRAMTILVNPYTSNGRIIIDNEFDLLSKNETYFDSIKNNKTKTAEKFTKILCDHLRDDETKRRLK